MEPITILKQIDRTFTSANTSDELITQMVEIIGDKKASPVVLSMPNFISSVVPLNPKTNCSVCKKELIPGSRCIKEYYLYSGPQHAINMFCRDCACDVIDDANRIRDKMRIKPLTNLSK